jgi:hypothetical protein
MMEMERRNVLSVSASRTSAAEMLNKPNLVTLSGCRNKILILTLPTTKP